MIKNIYSNIKDRDALDSFLSVLLTEVLIARVLNVRQHAIQNIEETYLLLVYIVVFK